MKRKFPEYVPKILSILIFFSGLMNIFSSFYARELARLEFISDFFPLQVSLASRTLSTLAGLALMYLAYGIWQQKKRSLVLALLVLLMSAVLHVVKGADYEESLACLVLAGLFLYFRNYFFILSGTIQVWQRIRFVVVVFAFLILYVGIGYVLLHDDFTGTYSLHAVWQSYLHNAFGIGRESLQATERFGRWFHDSISAISLFSYLLVISALFAPKKILNHRRADREAQLRNMYERYAHNTIAGYSLMSDKQHYVVSTNDGFIAYKPSGNSVMVLGDPLCEPSHLPEKISEFQSELNRYGFQVGFCYVEPRTVSLYEKVGYKKLHLGDEAIIPLANFSLEGSAMKDVRNAHNKIEKQNIEANFVLFSELDAKSLNDLRVLHHAWKKGKGNFDLTFSMDFYPLPKNIAGYLEMIRDQHGALIAALSFLPVGKTFVLDLFLRQEATPNGIMEFAIAKAAQYFKEQGVERLSLGLVGLTSLSQEQPSLFSKSAKVLIQDILRVYQYESLQRFKQKFQPTWEPRYFVYQKGTNFPKAITALLSVHLKHSVLGRIFS